MSKSLKNCFAAATRQHTDALLRKDALLLADHKLAGRSCFTCKNRQQIFYTHRCLPKKKVISIHNICHLWQGESK